jgi:hypothetical protein
MAACGHCGACCAHCGASCGGVGGFSGGFIGPVLYGGSFGFHPFWSGQDSSDIRDEEMPAERPKFDEEPNHRPVAANSVPVDCDALGDPSHPGHRAAIETISHVPVAHHESILQRLRDEFEKTSRQR